MTDSTRQEWASARHGRTSPVLVFACVVTNLYTWESLRILNVDAVRIHATGAGAYVNGAVIPVDGGMHI